MTPLDTLRRRVAECGSQGACARAIGVSESLVQYALRHEIVGPSLHRALGLHGEPQTRFAGVIESRMAKVAAFIRQRWEQDGKATKTPDLVRAIGNGYERIRLALADLELAGVIIRANRKNWLPAGVESTQKLRERLELKSKKAQAEWRLRQMARRSGQEPPGRRDRVPIRELQERINRARAAMREQLASGKAYLPEDLFAD